MRRSAFASLAAAILALAASPVQAVATEPAACGGTHWVGAWGAAPADAALPGFAEQSLRMIVHPHYGGDSLRLRLSNRFGSRPVTFGAVAVGKRSSGAALAPGTNRRVTFGGRFAVTLPARTEVLSDPVPLRFGAFTDLAVSMHVRGVSGPATEHPLAVQTSYTTALGSGDHTGSENGAAFTEQVSAWYFLAGIDVRASRGAGSVVALGDSITDGSVSTGGNPLMEDPAVRGSNGRYPDVLARRLDAMPGPLRLSVVNAGIAGNRVVSDGFFPSGGPSAVSRLDADVLAQAGVTDVIIMAGTNDLGMTPLPSADNVIDGLDHLVRRLHANGLNVLLGTIPPAGGAFPMYGTAVADVQRVKVNAWIRSRPYGVGVADFDEALRDPGAPDRLHPDYDSGDHLHPNLAGYRVMAQAVDLVALRGSRCNAT